MITIDIDELQQAISLLLKRLKERKGVNIELKNDYYWDIDSKELYNPYEQPKNFALGQLSFDWEHITKSDQDDLIPYDFEKVSCILKALSNEYPIAF
ncbi:hypothetical protein SNE25_02160 [Mucilaginibacter sabulilitoris]|uniref:Uncharacterized protein n=1 Tax=Mucilaginibacter sabulilitoris TaxID=1173583 RepID=A0ABZ0TNH7_9SPHI|nr:hypothetical protein [Mucilaginibacter sabulilitoris]WPU94326.1 hypothetical protein SNE25_02160 [Mucilaginibacter sabulilitoris]